jgi:flagellar hook-associated protein 3 FlgL
MARITPIPSTRVSDSLAYQRLLTQLQSDQVDLLRLQQQVSTGRRVQLPSDDAPASIRAIALQRLLEQKAQAEVNLQTSQSYLTQTDAAIADISTLLAESKASALAVTGTVADQVQREAVAQEIDEAIERLLNSGNQKFRGRFLFAGSRTDQLPFEWVGDHIRYNGNETDIDSFTDRNTLFPTNATGSDVFGAISDPVVGTTDLNPRLTPATRLSALHNGAGVTLGSIEITDGVNGSIIDLSSAHTLQDVANLIEASPPAGRTLNVEITPTGLEISIDAAGGGDLRIHEVGGGTTADDLGILSTTSFGTGSIVGEDLDPRLELTTTLADAFGAQAYALIDSPGTDNAIQIEALTRGPAFNGFTVTFSGGGTAGAEVVTYNALAQTINVQIANGVSTAAQVITALNADPGFSADFTASLDTTFDPNNDGTGAVTTTAAPIVTAHGSGIQFDQASGLQIVNGGQAHTIDISAAVTVEDMLNILNGSDAGVHAHISADGRTISLRSRLSGGDFAVGENGGLTATHLGLRSHTTATRLADLNHGLGIHPNVIGDDFIIRRKDGVELRFDVSSAQTIGDVIDMVNNHVDNLDPLTQVIARLNTTGNGIELVDNGVVGAGQLTVLKVNNSQAAEDLGLIPVGQQSITAAGGPSQILSGRDTNTRETYSLFTGLMRLRDALRANDTIQISRAVDLLEVDIVDVNFARAEVASNQQGLDVLATRIEDETIHLKSALSDTIEVDLAEAISELTRRQATIQASLQMTAQLARLTLMDYV